MKIRTNLALYPAAARRRSNWFLAASVALGLGLSAVHFVWAQPGASSAAELRAEAEALRLEAASMRTHLSDLEGRLDPIVVRELSDRVVIANDFIGRGAVDPVAFLALVETAAPIGLVLDRLSLTSSDDGLGAELSVRGSQADVSALVAELSAVDSIHDIAPVSEQIGAGSDQIVLAMRYSPRRDR